MQSKTSGFSSKLASDGGIPTGMWFTGEIKASGAIGFGNYSLTAIIMTLFILIYLMLWY